MPAMNSLTYDGKRISILCEFLVMIVIIQTSCWKPSLMHIYDWRENISRLFEQTAALNCSSKQDLLHWMLNQPDSKTAHSDGFNCDPSLDEFCSYSAWNNLGLQRPCILVSRVRKRIHWQPFVCFVLSALSGLWHMMATQTHAHNYHQLSLRTYAYINAYRA